jgi:thiol-disulfide isomerase/thioredoxin
LKKITRYTIAFFPVCCSLTLLTTACSQKPGSAPVDKSPDPIIGVEGSELRDLISQSEKPYVLLNFFATWCRPCRREFPELVALQKDPASKVKVLMVSIDKEEDLKSKLPGFLADNGVDFQTYARPFDEVSLIKEFYAVWNHTIPLSLIFTKGGEVLDVINGLTDRSEIELIINKHEHFGS